jgi:capsular polysaccharide transport system permease protein
LNRLRGLLFANRRYSLVVVLPSVLIGLWYGLIASDRYVSEARMLVERDTGGGLPGMDLGILSLGSSQTEIDAWLVKRFIESPAMVDHLDKALGLRTHYESTAADPFSRLWTSASRERFVKYYLDHVDVSVDPDALTLDLRVQGFEAAYAQKLGQAIAAHAEDFVNEVGQSLARQQVEFVQREVDSAYARLQKASRELIGFQNEKGLLSPEVENAAISQVIAVLQSELAQRRTELKALLAYLSPAAPDVQNLQKRISALERQIAQERSKQVRGAGSAALNDLLFAYKDREMEVQIARDIYEGGLKSLEAAKVDASRKMKHLVMVSAPTLPQTSTEPQRLYGWITVVVLLNLAYVIASLIISTIRDHRE